MSDPERDDVAVNEWRATLDKHIDSGGCLEAAQAASEERNTDTDTRRGVVRKAGAVMASVVGLGVALSEAAASPEWPTTPMAVAYRCTGEPDYHCIGHKAGLTAVPCLICSRSANPSVCQTCAGMLVANGVIGAAHCCDNGKWVPAGSGTE